MSYQCHLITCKKNNLIYLDYKYKKKIIIIFLLQVIATFIVISYSTPIFIAIITPIAIIYYIIQVQI